MLRALGVPTRNVKRTWIGMYQLRDEPLVSTSISLRKAVRLESGILILWEKNRLVEYLMGSKRYAKAKSDVAFIRQSASPLGTLFYFMLEIKNLQINIILSFNEIDLF